MTQVARSLVPQARFCFCAQLVSNLWQVYETIGIRFSSLNILFISIKFLTFLTEDYARDPGSFIYSLRNNDGLSPFKSTLKDESDQHAIYRYNIRGPTFGNGHDLHIASDAGSNAYSYTSFWSQLQPPTWLHLRRNQHTIPACRELPVHPIRSGSTLLELTLRSLFFLR